MLIIFLRFASEEKLCNHYYWSDINVNKNITAKPAGSTGSMRD